MKKNVALGLFICLELAGGFVLAGDAFLQPPRIISRQEWGALEPIGVYEPMTEPFRITVHNTEGPRLYGRWSARTRLRFMQWFHQQRRGWKDIAYHFVIDGRGRIYEGRPLGAQGSHVKDNNEGNIGIALMGDFDRQFPRQGQILSLTHLLLWLSVTTNIKIENIFAHRDLRPEATDCPGYFLYRMMPEIRQRVSL